MEKLISKNSEENSEKKNNEVCPGQADTKHIIKL